MIPENTFSHLMAKAAILEIKYHPNRQLCNFWTVMMCLSENYRIESWQIQMVENETLRIIWLHMVHNIACVMLKRHVFEIATNTRNF